MKEGGSRRAWGESGCREREEEGAWVARRDKERRRGEGGAGRRAAACPRIAASCCRGGTRSDSRACAEEGEAETKGGCLWSAW